MLTSFLWFGSLPRWHLPRASGSFDVMLKTVSVTDADWRRYLKLLEDMGRKTAAARRAGLDPDFVNERVKRDVEFAAKVEAAIRTFGEKCEAEVHRRALEGWDEPVFHKGTQCGVVRKYDSRLLELSVKRYCPEWREKLAVDATISGGVLIVGAQAADAQEWAARYAGAPDGVAGPPAPPDATASLPERQEKDLKRG